MRSQEIRDRFLAHFTHHGHVVVPSASLIATDPTLLLVNAGMVPFKPYFLGEQAAPHSRAASIQKVVRTNDIENVGRTARHTSFFEMAGNFSFGDYFKEGAITMAWELLTRATGDGGLGLPADRLWVTVYQGDDEAEQLWRSIVGVDPGRIQRRGMEDNYWSMMVPGPCGPCSEIYFDRGPQYGRDGGPVADEDRYLEVWNLVFMQYLRGPGPGYDYPILGELPAKNIDTGLGVDRMATVLQGVDNIYETDLVGPLLSLAAELTGKRYHDDPRQDVALRVIAEHSRTTTMLIADGVAPANEGRGYVLRRMLRRTVRNLRLLGCDDPSMPEFVAVVRDVMGTAYPELATDFERISQVAAAEEQLFLSTLRTGTSLFENAVVATRTSGSSTLSGDKAFALHDTYGFPIDLTMEMAAEQGLAVDEGAFRTLMDKQRQQAKADSVAKKSGHVDLSAYRSLIEQAGASAFTGYTEVVSEAHVRGLLVDNEAARSAPEGAEVELVLDRTPFYAEAGGQLADTGRIRLEGGGEVEVLDVQSPLPGLVVHRARVVAGEVVIGDEAQASVDIERRKAVSRSHTATHLIHTAIRRALGSTATQAGSLNDAGRLRFDFHNPTGVPGSVLSDVEDEVNAVLIDDLEVRAFVTTQAEAQSLGAMALFGEKYGDQVRVVEVGEYARELCGGTHAARSAQVGMVKILGEASIGAGVRRIDALVGLDAFRYLAREHVLMAQLGDALKVPSDQVPGRVEALVARLRSVEKALEKLQVAQVLSNAAPIAQGAKDVEGTDMVFARLPDGTTADAVRTLALDVRSRLGEGRPAAAGVLANSDGRVSVVVVVNKAGRAVGLKAGSLIREALVVIGGRGGGKDDLAQGSAPARETYLEVAERFEQLIRASVVR